jgi:TonB family protein
MISLLLHAMSSQTFFISIFKKFVEMKSPLSIVIVLMCFSSLCTAQTSSTIYCRDRACDTEVDQGKAKYSETVTEENGIITTTLLNLKKNEVESRTSWKGNEPVGQWVCLTGRGPEPMDYDFDLVYAKTSCSADSATVTNWVEDDEASGYKAPVVDGYESILKYIGAKLRYPSKARRTGIQGTIELEFLITETGTVENVVISRGVHLLLDKEAMRLFRSLKFSSPPMRNGKPQKLCAKFPLKFMLA